MSWPATFVYIFYDGFDRIYDGFDRERSTCSSSNKKIP